MRWISASLLVCALIASGSAGAGLPFERVVVFGTSLSDPGNAFALAGGTNTPPDYSLDPFLVPDRPYARGGHHFSNGATWIEQFAIGRGLGASAGPAFRGANAGATNYAIGGARAHEDGPADLPAQVRAFLRDVADTAPSDALYVVEMGGNDLRDALVVASGGGNPVPVLQSAVASIAGHIRKLHDAGARKFLVWNAPNIGLTPAINPSPAAAQGAAMLTGLFNALLNAALASLSGLPGIEIVRLDVFARLNDIVANPAAFGLADVKTACIRPGEPPFHCKNPDQFLFWDGIHPTRAGHGVIAAEAARALAASAH